MKGARVGGRGGDGGMEREGAWVVEAGGCVGGGSGRATGDVGARAGARVMEREGYG